VECECGVYKWEEGGIMKGLLEEEHYIDGEN
jgi:hypothetical protein